MFAKLRNCEIAACEVGSDAGDRRGQPYHRSIYHRFLKRPLDLLLASVALVILSPIYLTAAALIYLSMGRPVIFRQQRPGRNEKIFTVLKFRTMSDVKGPDGRLLNDKMRLTTVGKWLRLTSLDELPQLWNIVRGEMSFIGPRPLLISYLSSYTERERLRHAVRPGITGLAQINGRNQLEWDSRLALDVDYVERASARLDLYIAAVTVGKVLRQKNITVAVGPELFADLPEYRQNQQSKEAA